MKFLLSTAAVIVIATASFSQEEPRVEPDSDLTGGLILLALVGVVAASSALTGRAKAEKDPYLMPTEEADDQ